jgi:hypothetical protein
MAFSHLFRVASPLNKLGIYLNICGFMFVNQMQEGLEGRYAISSYRFQAVFQKTTLSLKRKRKHDHFQPSLRDLLASTKNDQLGLRIPL